MSSKQVLRKLALASAVSAAVMGSQFAHALGLGEIKLNSYLNEPLDAEIKLVSVGDLSKNEILPGLAGHEDFSRAGVERVFFLTDIKFDVQINPDGTALIKLKSNKIVREPFLNFLVQVHWPSGRLLREYTLLLDPPIFAERPAPVVQQAQTAPAQPSNEFVPQQQAIPSQTRPQTSPSRPAAQTNSKAGETVRVKKNDTLWSIAADVKPSDDVTVRQTMVALQRINPQAFINNNINLLKAGAVLRTPTLQEVNETTNREARREVSRQISEWQKKSTLDATQDNVMDRDAVAQADSSSAGQLKLVTDDPSGADDLSASAISESDNSLTSGDSYFGEGASSTGGSASSSPEVGALKDQVEDLKRIVALQNKKLALLQASLSESESQDGTGQVSDQLSSADEVTDSALLAVSDNSAGETLDSNIQSAPGSDNGATISGDAIPGEVADSGTDNAGADNAATPAPVTNQAASQKDQGMLASFMANPLYVGIAIVGALLLLAFIGIAARKRNEDETYPDDLRDALDQDKVDITQDMDESSVEAIADEIDEVDTPTAAEPLDADTEKVLEEADIYITYGRYERAQELLTNAISEDQQNSDLRLKLAEVHAATNNSAGLSQVEADLEALGDTEALDRLEAIKAEAAGSQTFADVEVSDHDDMSADITEHQAETTIERADELDDGPASVEEVAEAVSESPEEDVSDDLGALDFELPDDEQEEVEEPEVVEAEEADSADADDMDFLEDTDEAATKLELARAYIDMADSEAAKEILNEVVDEGNSSQQEEAKKLLESIG